MRLSEKAISLLTTKAKNRIAMDMDCSVFTVERWIKDNEDNGDLTKAKSLQIISEETGLPMEEILEESDVNETQS